MVDLPVTALTLFTWAGLAPAAVYADIQTGLVAYWPLNEGTGTRTADMSGNGHEGTFYNGVTWIAPGFLGAAAIHVDGNPGSRVAVGTWDPGEQLTLALWARWTGEQNKAPRTGLIGKRNDWSDVGIRWFSEVMTTGEVRMRNTTANLHRDIATLIADVTEFMTLRAGDLLAVGVPEHPPLARAGDEVTVEVQGVGRLENTLVPEEILSGEVLP